MVNNIFPVADNFGVATYAIFLFALTIWWSLNWGDATACPYTHIEDVIEGKTIFILILNQLCKHLLILCIISIEINNLDVFLNNDYQFVRRISYKFTVTHIQLINITWILILLHVMVPWTTMDWTIIQMWQKKHGSDSYMRWEYLEICGKRKVF